MMPDLARLTETYSALEALLKKYVPPGVSVQALTDEDFDFDQGLIVAKPPAVLIVLREEAFSAPDDLRAVLYQTSQNFSVLCGAQSLRSSAEERMGALELLSAVCDALAGARITLPSNNYRAQISLVRAALAQLDPRGTWYELQIRMANVAQFSGAEANV